MRILYVEDDPRDADLTIRKLLKTAPHLHLETVSTIHKAQERLQRIASEPLDLLLLDMHLRDGDGLSLLRHVRENRLPLAVVMITGMGDEETAVAAFKDRADDYVVKGKDYLDRLAIILQSALNHYRAEAARRSYPLKVLYALDELSEIEGMRRHLAVHADHIHLDVAPIGSAALSVFQQQASRYDVLLMDWRQGDLNALEVLRELRLTYKQDIPVVLVCHEGDEEFARQSLKLGASGYLVKSPGYFYQLPWELEQAYYRADLLRREAALRESEGRLRLAQQAARVGTWEWDVRTGAAVWSEMIWQLVGLEPGECEATLESWVEFIHPEDRNRALRKASAVVADGEEYYDEFRLTRRDGSILWVSAKGRIIRSADGRPERMIGVNIDINERKLAEESLKNALAEVQQLKDQLHAENVYLQEEIRVASNFGEFIGSSEALRRVLSQAEQVAPTDTTVLILGETGTGKELLAHAIHKLSSRHQHPLVKLNCATLPASLIESELFGHEKGAFTGAGARRRGRFEIADRGSIFLDEV